MSLPTIEEIVGIVLSDITVTNNLPASMESKAEYARNALCDPENFDIRFGRYKGYTFAVYHEDSQTWWDIEGHYHIRAPDDNIDRATARQAKYENKKSAIASLSKRWLKEHFLVEDGDRDIDWISMVTEYYYHARESFQRICSNCGDIEDTKTFHWHHINKSLRTNMLSAEEHLKTICPVENPENYYIALSNYYHHLSEYFSTDTSITVLLCPKCHSAVHHGKLEINNGTE